jgi:hypothetical protein
MNMLSVRSRRKLREWFIRYAPAEIAGTITALAGYWITYSLTNNIAAAAIVATITENIGYYGLAASREAIRHWHTYANRAPVHRIWLSGVHTSRTVAFEFGLAEIIDSLLVRPSLFYMLPLIFTGHHALAVLAAKFMSDIVFYLCVLTSYELQKRFLAKQRIIKRKGEPYVTETP